MTEEVLNIEYNTKLLVLKALRIYKKKENAARALGITTRTLNKLLLRYNIFLLNNNQVKTLRQNAINSTRI